VDLVRLGDFESTSLPGSALADDAMARLASDGSTRGADEANPSKHYDKIVLYYDDIKRWFDENDLMETMMA
jgi:hypothetical protein